MNTPVSFPIAKLLKEKKFDKECDSLFIYEIRNGDTEWKLIELFERNNKDTYDFLLSCDKDWQKHYLRPTISDVVMWLYEKHGIWIQVTVNATWVGRKKEPEAKYNSEVVSQNRNLKVRSLITRKVRIEPYDSPEAAYEAAILYTLNNLI